MIEICSTLGVAERTLRDICREHLGMGPHRYLLLRRLDRARQALRQARGSVTEIAYDYGFTELGRFARIYRQRFGETPSMTLR